MEITHVPGVPSHLACRLIGHAKEPGDDANPDFEATIVELEIAEVRGHELGPAEGASEPKQQKRAVSEASCVSPVAAAIAAIFSAVAGVFRFGAIPLVRLIPAMSL